MLSWLVLIAVTLPTQSANEPRTPAATAASLKLPAEFVVDVIASEPLIQSPVAIAWDDHGVLFVVEMVDYPTEKTGGTIKRLEDTNGDGVMDKSTVFAGGLPFPNGAMPINGGLMVTAAPDILFLKDTDGDGKADEREVLFTGFGEGNPQLRANGLRYGMDNWIYGANGRNNGEIKPGAKADPAAKPISIASRDFRFRPDGTDFQTTASFSQFGIAFDDWGNRFLSWNTIHIRHAVMEDEYLRRSPLLLSAGGMAHIADHGDAGRVFPLSTPQPRHNREPPGYFNASCGIAIDQGGIFPPEYAGSAFICEPLFGVVHRDKLTASGATFVASRGHDEKDHEFIASTDTWFRPVNLATGPDGGLYVLDFYREWIDHPAYVPDELEKDIAFRNGADRGRIYRIRPKDAQLLAPVDLAKLSNEQLVSELAHVNGWQRMTAHRLLVERNDSGIVEPLEKQATSGASPVARLHSTWVLKGMKRLSLDVLRRALVDADSHVRRHAVKLVELHLASDPALSEALNPLVNDSDAAVRFQLACTLGELSPDKSTMLLASLAGRDVADAWMRMAILSSIHRAPGDFIEEVVRKQGSEMAPGELSLLEQAAEMAAIQDQGKGADRLIEAAGAAGSNERACAILVGVGSGLARRGQLLADRVKAPATWKEKAAAWARDAKATPQQAVLAFRLIGFAFANDGLEILQSGLSAEKPDEIQRAAVAGLGRSRDPKSVAALIAYWPAATSAVREEISKAILRRPESVKTLLAAIEAGEVSAADLGASWREALKQSPDAAIRDRAASLFKSDSNRQQLVEKYRPALDKPGDRARGQAVFTKHCFACHRVRGQGFVVGPELSGLVVKEPAHLLVDILDPNREVMPNYDSFTVITKDGGVLTGLLAGESAGAVVLRRAEGNEESILRDQIETLRGTGKSLMPEGFEQQLSPTDIADLIAFLRRPEE